MWYLLAVARAESVMAAQDIASKPERRPTWTTWREAIRVVMWPPHLTRTIRVALVVGTILFAINHLDEVLRGEATWRTWTKGLVTYLVPFCVANIGVLVATRRLSA
ncbi:MAG TPA: nitrate/nitrite transporter NrtS [Vicinamibacterales bacterium]|nr:nitrate/nitrite transporter NrtS [Vicinamibacterales bacterium]